MVHVHVDKVAGTACLTIYVARVDSQNRMQLDYFFALLFTYKE